MSPRTADPAVREALIEAAAGLIARHEALTTRRLAAEVGTSTMAVYTHFGSLDEVRRAVRRVGFDRLRANMERVRETDDPVADVGVLGWGYCANAIHNPNLYRAMFMEAPLDEQDAGAGLDTFERLVAAVGRCGDAGRFEPGDPWERATLLWTSVHGASALYLAGMLSEEDVLRITAAGARAYLIEFGDEPSSVDRSIEAVRRRVRGSDWDPAAGAEGHPRPL
jgi:AcrR family transcriptional regulator